MENRFRLISGRPWKFHRRILRYALPTIASVISILAPVSFVVALFVHSLSEMSAAIYVFKGLTK